ncbi:MAG: DNA polymerase III subunit delta [Sedimentisphaerales bacterium]
MTSKNKTGIKPIYVIAGKDGFLVKNECERLLDELIEPEQRTTGLWRVEGRDTPITNVLDELRTLPFLGERRVAVIENADKTILKKQAEEEGGDTSTTLSAGESQEPKEGADETASINRAILERYFDKPSTSGVLVLTVSSWPSNTKLAKKLANVGRLVEVGQLKANSLVSYIQNYGRETHNKNLSYNAAQMLIEFIGEEPGALCSEIDKLAAYVNTAKMIAEKDIEAASGHNRIFGVFEVIDAMTAGNTGKALEKFRLMFQSDKKAEYTVLGAFAWHFRRMFSASAMLKNGQSHETISRKLRIWNSDGFFGTLKKMPLERIGSCLKRLAEIDYDVKTGRATAETAIETMIVQLAQQ